MGLIVERLDGGIAVVRIDNPPSNRLSVGVLKALAGIGGRLSDPSLIAVVFTGANGVFSLGGDHDLLPLLIDGEDGPERVHGYFRAACDAVAGLPCATIAALDGPAAGGGFELALSCDLRVAAPNITMRFPESTLGIIPGAGGTQRLSRLIGVSRALELILTARSITAEHGLSIGLVNRLSGPAETAVDSALCLARTFPQMPVAIAASKAAVTTGYDTSLAEAMDIERTLFVKAVRSQDARAALTAPHSSEAMPGNPKP